ncbi:MAG: hypothetical protein HY420_04115 [Candidatus Kerfeldbacteria bacterium]|nr:hypothetical protein [Candidatus Kerfeldbacteria bacterium]
MHMTLTYRTIFILAPKPPFHFDGTFHKPSHFPNRLKLEDWKPGTYWQTIRFRKRLFGLMVENKGTVTKPKLKVSVFSQSRLSREVVESLKREIAYRFELEKDLREFQALAKRDPRFYPVFKKWMGMRNSGQYNLYELLVISVVLQNATVRRSSQMLDALLGRFGIKVIFGGKVLHAIWLPKVMARVSEQELRRLKVGYRAKFFKRLSQDFARGKIDELALRNKPAEDMKKELVRLYGVGPETARILLFEVFHHDAAFDHVSPWQQKIYSRLFYGKRLVAAEKIRRDIQRRYGKYAMLAVHYIWEDVFWRRKHEHIPWLEKEIRL